MTRAACGLTLLLAAIAAGCHRAPAPDAVFLHGSILTLDPAHPLAQALAVRGERLLAVGNDADIAKLAGRTTRRVDLGGRFVTPGFNDAHVHMADAGTQMLNLDLTGARSLAEFQQRIRVYSATLGPGDWLIGAHWDHTLWPGQRFPTRRDLDGVTGDHAAVLYRMDGHALVANSRALAAAGINRSTAAPQGGKIDHDAAGEPDGMFFDQAQALIARHLPPPSPARRRAQLVAALHDAAAHGVTSIQDFSTFDDYLVYEQLKKKDVSPVRVSEWIPFNLPLDQIKGYHDHHDPNDPWLHTGMLKAFMDGSLGSRTAALLAPYSDDPGNRGLPYYDAAKLNAMAVERARAGYQLGFHAIGDLAARMALDAFQAAADAGAPPGRRNRIEHLQVVDPGDLPRLKALGVVASLQPAHLLDDDRWAAARLGPARVPDSYLLRSLLDRGIPVAFGTDDPVEPIDPMLGLYSAVTRASRDGKIVYQPQEAITLDQALTAYTAGSAYAQFAERDKGRLEPGMLADFTVLSQDLRQTKPADWLATHAVLTVVGGRVTYAGPDWK